MNFKKGDLVTRIGSWDQTGTVYVTHYIVSSWGKQQATLVKVGDLTNAKFRVYTDSATLIQGIHSSTIIPTADYSEALAMQLAKDWIADEDRRASDRLNWNLTREFNAYGAYDRPAMIKFEQRVYDEHKATPWQAAVKVVV
jgi:hypothetical protein